VISRTNDTDGAKTAAERLAAKLGVTNGVTVRSVADGTVLASTSDYADKLAGSGGLGNSDLFKAALPDLNGAQFVIYVDVQRAAKLGDSPAGGAGSEVRAVGMTSSTQAGSSTVHLRVVV
jgi:hypothetical protein